MITPANWERIRALFQRALEHPADERATFLREQSDGDEAIRREVELAAGGARRGEGFLDGPGRGATRADDDDDARAVTPRLAPGSRLGAFEILGRSGRAGWARSTRRATRGSTARWPSRCSRRRWRRPRIPRRRFEREAKAISALNHPHICELYDIGRQDRIEYLVLELVEGETLAARLTRGRLPMSQALGFGVQIADALEAAHRQDIIHRDLKPGNVMLTPAGRPESIASSRLTWFDRSGRRTGTLGEPGPYELVVLSPSGRRAAVVRRDAEGNGDLWDADLASGIFSRLTSDPADEADPSWSPDERALAFTSTRTGRVTVFVKDLVTGKENQLVPFDEGAALDQWTPDGKFVIFRTYGKAVYAMRLGGDRKPRLLVDTPYLEDEVHVSPDGRWVAFNSDESGVWEVYVAAFPAFTSKRPISSGGGVQPQWRGDGRELFYLAPDGSMMSVRVDARPELTLGPVTRLFPTNIPTEWGRSWYGVTDDGQRFLALEPVPGAASFTFLLNWPNARPAQTR